MITAHGNETIAVENSPPEVVDIDGTLRIDHTSVESDDHVLEIDCNAAGFGDVKAIDIAYITGAISTGEEEGVILINLDETAATGGDVWGLEMISTEGSADLMAGLFVGAGVGPIEQLSGVFADADTVLVNAVDETTDLSGGGAGNVSIFVADNDTMTIGSSAKFEEIEKNSFVLTPGRYVGAADQEEDDEPFDQKMKRLTALLKQQQEDGAKLDQQIAESLRRVGYV